MPATNGVTPLDADNVQWKGSDWRTGNLSFSNCLPTFNGGAFFVAWAMYGERNGLAQHADFSVWVPYPLQLESEPSEVIDWEWAASADVNATTLRQFVGSPALSDAGNTLCNKRGFYVSLEAATPPTASSVHVRAYTRIAVP